MIVFIIITACFYWILTSPASTLHHADTLSTMHLTSSFIPFKQPVFKRITTYEKNVNQCASSRRNAYCNH